MKDTEDNKNTVLGGAASRFRRAHEGMFDEATAYFAPWTFDKPVIISPATNERMRRIQKLLYKAIQFLVAHYGQYRHIMPLSERVSEVLSFCAGKPYRAGTYRTDYLVNRENEIRIIEITCRYAFNGYLSSGFFKCIADRHIAGKPWISVTDDYTKFYGALAGYFGDFKHVCLLKGKEGRNDTKYVVTFFENAGFTVHYIPVEEAPAKAHLFEGAAVIGELSHDEICAMPDETIRAIISSCHLNDLRTVFLIHDKRFFAVLNDEGFQGAAFAPDEAAEFRQYLAPTFTSSQRPDIWEGARRDKSRWVIKPCVLGKSIDVFAGPLTSDQEWEGLFSNQRQRDMVIQAWIDQRTFKGSVRGVPHDDYAAGTLLFFEDAYFGPGLFRTSSHPVTNKVDDRKMAPLVTGDMVGGDYIVL